MRPKQFDRAVKCLNEKGNANLTSPAAALAMHQNLVAKATVKMLASLKQFLQAGRARGPALAASAGLAPPTITATRPSAFSGLLYVAIAERLPDHSG